jgi:hypothetical protein
MAAVARQAAAAWEGQALLVLLVQQGVVVLQGVVALLLGVPL